MLGCRIYLRFPLYPNCLGHVSNSNELCVLSVSLRITHFPLVVKSQAKALEFYTEKVGFEKKADVTSPGGYRWVTVGPKGQDIELSLTEEGFLESQQMKGEPGGTPPIVLQVGDLRKTFDEMKSRGVRFKTDRPEENPYAISAVFSDPDGNLFQINQFPGARAEP